MLKADDTRRHSVSSNHR